MLIPKVEPSDTNVLVGGSVNALVNLCKILGPEVKITVLAGGRERVKDKVAQFFPSCAGVNVITCRAPAQSVRYGAEFLMKSVVWALFRRGSSVDIVHGHSGYGIYAWVTWLVSRVTGARPVHTLYCPMRQNSKVLGRKSGALRANWARSSLNWMDAVVAMSKNIAISLTDAGVNPKTVRQLPSAVDTKRFAITADRESVRQRVGVPPGKKVLLFVGNLTDSKGIWDLLTAFSAVSAHDENTYLVITLELSHSGFEQSEKRFYSALEELQISDRVIRLGFVDFMPDLVAFADGLAVPFRDTQGPSDYPLILMEAMAAGTPAVGTTVGGIPELMQGGSNGWLVDPDCPQEFAGALMELLSDTASAASRAQKAKKYIDDQFGAEKVQADHLSLYKEILISRRG